MDTNNKPKKDSSDSREPSIQKNQNNDTNMFYHSRSDPVVKRKQQRNSALREKLKMINDNSGSATTSCEDPTEISSTTPRSSEVIDLNVSNRRNSVSRGLEVYSKDHDEMMKILRNIDKNATSTNQAVLFLVREQSERIRIHEKHEKKQSSSSSCCPCNLFSCCYQSKAIVTTDSEIQMQSVPNEEEGEEDEEEGGGGEESIEYYTDSSSISCCTIC
jgi:hypothetical protein